MIRREKLTTFYLYSMICVSLLLAGTGFVLETPIKPGAQAKLLEILGFYTGEEPGLPSSEASVRSNADNLTFIAPFYYRLKQDGREIEKWNYTTDKQIKDTVRLARSKDIKVLALVHNLLYGESETGRQAAREVLRDDASRHRFASQALELVRRSGYDGINLDIENMYPEDRDNLSLLVKELKTRFAPHDLLVTVCVPAHTEQSFAGWGRNFDYKTIGRWADRVVVMAYDQHGYSSGPGPVAGLPWVNDVADFSARHIPREKILLGVPAYGFDWTENKPYPKYLSYQTAADTASRVEAVPAFKPVDQVPGFNYQSAGEKHQVWFENAASFAAKAELAKKHGLRGLAIWRLGMEDPGIWDYAKKEISTPKI